VKSKTDHSTEAIKHILRTNINPTEIKIGINTFKSLKDRRVLIEAPTKEEINVLSENITAKCGNELDVHVPTLFKPRLVIRNVPEVVTVENIESTIMAQNPELSLKQGEVVAKFRLKKREQGNIVIEVGPQTRKKLLATRLKLCWQICYLEAKRCFISSRFGQRFNDCKGEETCPLCAGNHKLKECTTPESNHKCTNCIAHNTYNKG
ncbi:hypothetical protein C0J52_25500, partial [Blattella germanica]